LQHCNDPARAYARTAWNPALFIQPREFAFTDAEIARIRTALETWNAYAAGADRNWLEPLLDALRTQP
jgi:hypothetical protein